MRRQEVVPEQGRVFVAEPVVPVVTMTAELRLALDDLKRAGVGLEAEIVAAEVRRLSRQLGTDVPAAAAVGGINPIVEPVFKTVDPMLLISWIETSDDRFAQIGPAIAVGVFGIKNFRRGADEHAFAPDHDAVRERDVRQKHSRFSVTAVTIGVLQVF